MCPMTEKQPKSDKELIQSLAAKVDALTQEISDLRRGMVEWKNELVEEFGELTGILVEHYQKVIDHHMTAISGAEPLQPSPIPSPSFSSEESTDDLTVDANDEVSEEGDKRSDDDIEKEDSDICESKDNDVE